eukprot:3453941-Amphidinium_carterae.1
MAYSKSPASNNSYKKQYGAKLQPETAKEVVKLLPKGWYPQRALQDRLHLLPHWTVSQQLKTETTAKCNHGRTLFLLLCKGVMIIALAESRDIGQQRMLPGVQEKRT